MTNRECVSKKYPVRVFVYGTLMKGFRNHPLMALVSRTPEPALLEDYAMQYCQYLDYRHKYAQVPMIYPKLGGFIMGEIYEVYNIERLDMLEHGYAREYCPKLNAFFYCSDTYYEDLYDVTPDKDNVFDFRTVACDDEGAPWN